MKWILIYLILSFNGNASTGAVEFDNQQACEKARQSIQRLGWKVESICVQKS